MSEEQTENTRNMKDSGVKWIGSIPSNWHTTKIKYIFTIISGGTPSEHAENWDGSVIWITPADYKTADMFVYNGKRNISQIGYKSCSATLVPAESIIFSKRAPIGSVAISTVELCTNQGCLSCVRTTQSNIEFFYYVMSISTKQFELLGAGTTFNEISASNFGNFLIPYPPYFEQNSIAFFLDCKCSRIDTIAKGIREQIDILKAYKQSIITETVTNGLDYDAAMKDSGVEWIGTIPKNWSVIPNKYLFFVYKKIVWQNSKLCKLLSLTKSGIIEKDKNVLAGKLPSSFGTYQYVKKGQLVLCLFDLDISAVFSGLSEYDGMISPSYTICNCNDVMYNEYAKYWFEFCFIGRKYKMYSKSLRFVVNCDNFETIPALLPPLEEQHKIADFLNHSCSEIDRIIDKKQSQLEILGNYKKSLIYEYVTGKKSVFVSD